jgi:dipeptidyl aminopeptidase/acylaminoacyl peptidase
MHVGAKLVGALLLGLVGASAAWAKGGGQKPKPPPKSKLPAGCELLADGRSHALSLDGKSLAFARWTPDPGDLDYHAEPIPKARVFVRTLATKKDVEVKGTKGWPVGWTTTGGLCLSTGTVVDPATGKTVPGTAVMPVPAGGAKPVSGVASLPAGITVDALAWTRDGSRLAYACDWTDSQFSTSSSVPQYLCEVDATGKVRLFDFGDKVYSREGGTLSWSPDGKLLAFDIPFSEMGQVPPRRIGFIDTDEKPRLEGIAEFSQKNGVPGHHEARRAMRPHAGTTGPVLGACVWDGATAHLVYVTGTGDGNADVHLWDLRAGSSRALTKDGATKWSPAIDAEGRRVAFLTGKVQDWPNPREMTLFAPLPKIDDATLRVLDVLTGIAKDYPVPGEPAYPGNVTWSPDGTRILYEIHTGGAEGVYAQTVPAAPAPPAPADPGKK